jgi:hypothetical protein
MGGVNRQLAEDLITAVVWVLSLIAAAHLVATLFP